MPSKFDWIRSSPRKRNPPAVRLFLSEEQGSANSSNVHINDENTGDFPIIQADINNESLTADIPLTRRDSETQTAELFENAPLEINKSTSRDTNSHVDCDSLCVKEMLDKSERKNEQLHKQLFNLERFKNDDSSIAFYTGFPNYDTLKAIFNYLNPGENGENINYWLSSTKSVNVSVNYEEELYCNKMGRCRSLKPVDEFFLVLCKLRQGFAEMHLAHLFNISQPTVSRIFITWINFMYLKFGQINIWPSRASVNSTMPEDFKKEYGSTRVIIDCTEVRCEMPSSLHLNGELFSSYKHHTTLKGLIGITPGGAISFISQLYTGSISDREIVIRSGLLELPFDESDSVMADKGFTIEDLLPLGVYLNIPPFLGKSPQIPADQVVLTQKIASLRIHVERAINKIKNFHIWDGVLPLNLFGLANQIWSICAFLCNAQPSIISV